MTCHTRSCAGSSETRRKMARQRPAKTTTVESPAVVAAPVTPPQAPVVLPPTCGDCKHWRKVEHTHYGQCTRYPPSIPLKVDLTEHGPFCMFPITLPSLPACGEHPANKPS